MERGNDKTCAVEGCSASPRARGWCPKHWKRWRKYGDPTMAKFEPIRGGTDEERFWAKVTPTGFCWYWGGSTTGDKPGQGHGYFNLGAESDRRGVVAHKFAYETLVGLVPQGLELDHLCRNTSCVNPDHLEPITHEENMRRGHSRLAMNIYRRTKTCVDGHDTSQDDQVFITKSGRRTCKKCAARRQREYLDRKKAAREGS